MKEQDLERDIREEIQERYFASFEKILREVFEERRLLFVQSLAWQLKPYFQQLPTSSPSRSLESESSWEPVESLSRLRSLVGGRFQNLRKRWIEAGLPLREHRGDRTEDYKINEEGWLALSNWILKQGYESRLTPNQVGRVMELRKK